MDSVDSGRLGLGVPTVGDAASGSRRSAIDRRHLVHLGLVGLAAGALWGLWIASGADFVVDDTFITFRYANNLARGYGPVWNLGGEPTQGYTNPLLVGLLAVGYLLGIAPLLLAHVLNALGLGAILCSVHHLSGRFVPETASAGWRELFGVFAPLAVLAFPVAIPNALSGLETGLTAGLLFAAASLLLHYRDTKRRAVLAAFSGVAFASMLSRPDSALVVGAWFFALLLWPPRAERVAVASALGAVLVAGLAYLAWLTATFGHPLPNSFFVKVSRPLALPGRDYVADFLLHHGIWLAVAAAGLALLRDRKALALRLLPHAALLLLPIFYLFTDPLMGGYQRFLFAPGCFLVAAAALLALAAATADATALRGRFARALAIALVATVVLVGGLRTARMLGSAFLDPPHDALARTLERTGRALATVPAIASTRIALGPAGAVPFTTDAQVIDLVGLNDNEIARRAKERGASWVIDYALDQRPDLVFFLSHRDGRVFDRGHGVIGSAYPSLYADPRFARDYEHVSAVDIGRVHGHWFVHRDSRHRDDLARVLGELDEFGPYVLRSDLRTRP